MKLFQTVYNVTYTPAEAVIAAKYSMLIVKQPPLPGASLTTLVQWITSIKAINPSCKVLTYLMTAQEPGITAPGSGDKILMNWASYEPFIEEPWLMTASGDVTAYVESVWKVRRLFDYRKPVWQSLFKSAAATILNAYQFDGIFFDNCTANWAKHAPHNPTLAAGLQTTLLDIRRSYPDKLFIGNCSENWMGLNGEMSEGAVVNPLVLELKNGQTYPNMNCYYAPVTISTPDADIAAKYNIAKSKDAWFGVYDATRPVFWPSVFDTLT